MTEIKTFKFLEAPDEAKALKEMVTYYWNLRLLELAREKNLSEIYEELRKSNDAIDFSDIEFSARFFDPDMWFSTKEAKLVTLGLGLDLDMPFKENEDEAYNVVDLMTEACNLLHSVPETPPNK